MDLAPRVPELEEARESFIRIMERREGFSKRAGDVSSTLGSLEAPRSPREAAGWSSMGNFTV